MDKVFYNKNSVKILGLLVPIAVWGVLSIAVDNPVFLPSIGNVVETLIKLFAGGFLLDVLVSVARVFAGLVAASLIAFPLGVALGVNEKIRQFGSNTLSFVRYIPPSAFIPLLILWMGIGEFQKIFFIFIAIAPYIALLVADAVLRIPKHYSEHAQIHEATFWQKIWTITIPAVMPEFLSIIRAMYGAAWTFIILAEIVGATNGIGHVMVQAQRFLQTDVIFVGIIVTGIIGITSDVLLVSLGKKIFKWRHL
jgi:NitT/TauT family transport system permease protein